MKYIIAILTLLMTPALSAPQHAERLEALAVTLERVADRWFDEAPANRERLVLDRTRTAKGEESQAEIVRNLATRIGARLGVVESYCIRLPRNERGLLQTQVREGWTVFAVNITEWYGDSAIVQVTGWHGSGMHTGGSSTYLVEKSDQGWKVSKHLTSGSGACIPGG